MLPPPLLLPPASYHLTQITITKEDLDNAIIARLNKAKISESCPIAQAFKRELQVPFVVVAPNFDSKSIIIATNQQLTNRAYLHNPQFREVIHLFDSKQSAKLDAMLPLTISFEHQT